MATKQAVVGDSKRMDVIEKAYIEIMGLVGQGTAIMRNVSRTGAMLSVYENEYVPQKGEIIHITSEVVDSFAEVVWTKENRAGVCFVPETEIEERVMMRRTAFGID